MSDTARNLVCGMLALLFVVLIFSVYRNGSEKRSAAQQPPPVETNAVSSAVTNRVETVTFTVRPKLSTEPQK